MILMLAPHLVVPQEEHVDLEGRHRQAPCMMEKAKKCRNPHEGVSLGLTYKQLTQPLSRIMQANQTLSLVLQPPVSMEGA